MGLTVFFVIAEGTFGLKPSEHAQYKGLGKENLRDHSIRNNRQIQIQFMLRQRGILFSHAVCFLCFH